MKFYTLEVIMGKLTKIQDKLRFQIFLFRGNRYYDNTYSMKNGSKQWKSSPPMNHKRSSHGCGSFELEGEKVLVVAGNFIQKTGKSVEFLLPDANEPKWIEGKLLSHISQKFYSLCFRT